VIVRWANFRTRVDLSDDKTRKLDASSEKCDPLGVAVGWIVTFPGMLMVGDPASGGATVLLCFRGRGWAGRCL
jgi:hypothetical protein